jgi:hypothetical protein
MLISLCAKNKLGFINWSIPTLGESNPKYSLWQRCNDMVLSWILNSLNQELANSVIYMETPSEIWLDLQERFSKGDFSSLSDSAFHCGVKAKSGFIFIYYTKIKTL